MGPIRTLILLLLGLLIAGASLAAGMVLMVFGLMRGEAICPGWCFLNLDKPLGEQLARFCLPRPLRLRSPLDLAFLRARQGRRLI